MKMRMKMLFVASVLLCGLVVGTVSADYEFTHQTDDQWGTLATNWWDLAAGAYAPALPTLAINTPLRGNIEIGSGVNAQANVMWLGPWAGQGRCDLVVNGNLSMERLVVAPQDNASLTINEGANVIAELEILVGANYTGDMIMTGGYVDAGIWGLKIGGNGSAHLEISGGTINTSWLDFDIWGGANGSGSINFSGPGQIIVAGNGTEGLQGWIDDGRITNAQVDYVSGVGNVISQVPEPATLLLLGIGSMVMMRRRK